ncbi:MAG: hypothetical protein ACRBN8_34630 [Nannocystales bacterium]
MQALDRLLALVCRELGATRSWVEYGNAPPPNAVSATIRDGWRLCADLDEPTDEARAQLDELVSSFDRVLLEATGEAPVPQTQSDAGAPLRQMLDVLVDRVGASCAWVVDDRSPMVWGASRDGAWLGDADQARRVGEALGEHSPKQILGWLDGQQLPPTPRALVPHLATIADAIEDIGSDLLLTTWAAIAQASNQNGAWSWDRDPLSVIVRPFAAIYRLIVLFDDEFSPLHAETTITRALPVIERLVADHPPVDPTPKGARIHAFIRPTR